MRKQYKGFSLAEVLAALVIGSMVLVAVLGIYRRAEHTASTIRGKLSRSRLSSEVLQLIAEDFDRILTPRSDTKVTVENKLDRAGYSIARLTILRTIYNKGNKPQTFEKIVWQSMYDPDNDLVLYRQHSGLAPEDKLLDEQREDWEKESFVPMCAGITFFKVQALRGEDYYDRWTSISLPKGIAVTISFAEPFKTLDGTMDVPDSQKTTRTLAIDRTRKVRFVFVPKEDENE